VKIDETSGAMRLSRFKQRRIASLGGAVTSVLLNRHWRLTPAAIVAVRS
jgi:hypothetical protein